MDAEPICCVCGAVNPRFTVFTVPFCDTCFITRRLKDVYAIVTEVESERKEFFKELIKENRGRCK